MHRNGVKLNATPKHTISFKLCPSSILVTKKEIWKKEREGKVENKIKL